jgi:hypothetical protein
VGLNIQNGWICQIKCPFAPAPLPDKAIFIQWLKIELQEREMVEADNGHYGDFCVSFPSD